MHHLSKDEIAALLERAQRQSHSLYTMILLGWRHGLRASEICGLQVRDIDLLGGFITVQRKKGSLKTTQSLFREEQDALKTLMWGKTKTEYLFPGHGRAAGHITRQGFGKAFRGLCSELAFASHLRHPHVLKHTCGMTVIKTGIENARQYLGHKSIASTGAYLRVTDDAACRAAARAFDE